MVATIHVCRTCGGAAGEVPGGAALAERVRAVLDGPDAPPARIASVDCMGACALPVSLGLAAPGRAHYLFAGLTPDDADDVVATLRCWLEAPRGWIVDARPCGRLRHCLRARIPAG